MFARPSLSISARRAATSFASAPSVPVARSFSSSAPPTRASKLTGADLTRAVGGLNGWTLPADGKKDVLVKAFVFADFNTAFGVMSRIALLAEKMNHHPNWSNVYNRLNIELETHDVGGVSNFDIYMAQQIETYVAQTKKTQQ